MGKKKLKEADGPECFWVNHGPVLRNLEELHRALQEMSDAQYKHHVEGGRNDFAVWVAEVLEDPKCASSLRRVKRRTTAADRVGACLGKKK